MNLSDLNSGPVSQKTWLNPQVNTLTADTITVNKEIVNISIQTTELDVIHTINLGSVTPGIAPGPITLAASEVVSGIFFVTGSAGGTIIINMPTAAALAAEYTTAFPGHFFFYVYNYSTSNLHFTLGTGCRTVLGNTEFNVSVTGNVGDKAIVAFHGGSNNYLVIP